MILMILISILATASAIAQPTSTVVANVTSGHLVVSNASTKEVIAFVVHYDTTTEHPETSMTFDFYFKPHGLPAGEVMDLTDDLSDTSDTVTVTKATILFAQFVDGSTWGDANDSDAKAMLERRPVTKQFYQNLVSSYAQGEQAFLDRLNVETKNSDIRLRLRAGALQHTQKRDGTQAVIDALNQKIAAANSHTF